jgi:hypothetical protein
MSPNLKVQPREAQRGQKRHNNVAAKRFIFAISGDFMPATSIHTLM